MPSRRFVQAKPLVTLGLLILAWIFVPTVAKRFARLTFFELQAPLGVGASYVRDLQDYWSMRTRSKNELIAAYRDLGSLNATYAHAASENAALRDEIRRLENLLRLPSFANYRSEAARVARRDFSAWWQRIVIRKGRHHGVPVGAPVIFSGGVVGRVSEVHAYTAVVELISSPQVRLAASVEGDDRPVSYQGGLNAPFTAPRGTVEFVPLDVFASFSAPLPLVTSGLGGVFPRGLAIGQVVQLEPSADGLFKTGHVNLDPRLNRLSEVTVLVPLDSP